MRHEHFSMIRSFHLADLFTLGNAFCGVSAILETMKFLSTHDAWHLYLAALLIPVALVLDVLDGRIARSRYSASPMGRELDSLADVVSFGMAPAILAFTWGLQPLKRLGWAVGFLYVAAAAMRLARFNIQTSAASDKRYFVGLPSPAAASVIASTVYLYPYGLHDRETALPALAMVLVPAFLMVSTIRFRSVKAIDVGWQRSYLALFLAAVGLALIATHPRYALVTLSYSYVTLALAMWGYGKMRRRPPETPATPPASPKAIS